MSIFDIFYATLIGRRASLIDLYWPVSLCFPANYGFVRTAENRLVKSNRLTGTLFASFGSKTPASDFRVSCGNVSLF